MDAEADLLAMFDAVAEALGTQLTIYYPAAGTRDPVTGAIETVAPSTRVPAAVRGAWPQRVGQAGRGRSTIEEGVYTVRADQTVDKPTDACWVNEVNTTRRQEVTTVDEVCGGLFWVIHCRVGASTS